MTLFDEKFHRMMSHKGFKKNIELSKYLNLRPNTISTWKKRGDIPDKIIFAFCEKDGLSANYIKTGEGPKYIGRGEDKGGAGEVAEDAAIYIRCKKDTEVDDLVDMARWVLSSGTGYSVSLAANIRSFHCAVQTETRLNKIEENMADLNSQVAALTVAQKDRIRNGDPPEKKDDLIKMRGTSSL